MTSDQMTEEKERLGADLPKGVVQEAWDLAIYKKAYAISLMVHKATRKFPREEQFEMASQMRRCSKGICANLSESFAKQPFSKAEFRRFVSIAIGSAAEMQVWTQYSRDLEYISKEKATDWKLTYKAVSRMLQRLHMSI